MNEQEMKRVLEWAQQETAKRSLKLSFPIRFWGQIFS